MMWQIEHTEVTHLPAKCQISHLMHGVVGLPAFHEPSAYTQRWSSALCFPPNPLPLILYVQAN